MFVVVYSGRSRVPVRVWFRTGSRSSELWSLVLQPHSSSSSASILDIRFSIDALFILYLSYSLSFVNYFLVYIFIYGSEREGEQKPLPLLPGSLCAHYFTRLFIL